VIDRNAQPHSNDICGPLLPSQPDVFIASTHGRAANRPVLRPTLSHNNTYHTPSPATWPRRVTANEGDGILPTSFPSDRPRTSTVATNSAPVLVQEQAFRASSVIQLEHEANAPFATLTSGTSTTSSSTQPHSSTYDNKPSVTTNSHNSHQITTSRDIHTGYNDDSAFHTTSYGSYDSSFSSSHGGNGNSPWLAPIQAQLPHPYYPMYAMPPQKEIEPILAPGEIPAPRPPMSYAALIGEALLMAPPPHQLYVSEISDSVKKRYACECCFVCLHPALVHLSRPCVITHSATY
jgi:hypothetical protein